MKHIVDKANEIYEKYGNDPEQIAEDLGLHVVFQKMACDLKEIYFRSSDSIVIEENLPETEKRELIAHAICHHLYHLGNHVLRMKRIYSYGNYQEKQADVFAACLLIPSGRFQKLIKDKPSINEIAECFLVTEKLARLRLLVWANFERDLTGQVAKAS